MSFLRHCSVCCSIVGELVLCSKIMHVLCGVTSVKNVTKNNFCLIREPLNCTQNKEVVQ